MFFRRGLVLASAASGITAATVVALSGDKAGFPAFVRAESAKPTRTFADPHGFQFPREKSKWIDDWDGRENPKAVRGEQPKEGEEGGDPATQAAAGPTATRHIILIRHGQYHMEAKEEEKMLTELGRRQAEATGRRLKELELPFTKMCVSTVVRARETADLIAESLASVPRESPDDILKEGPPIRPEPDVLEWRPDSYWNADGARIEAAFRKYFRRADATQKEDSYEVIVCHANVIRYFVCRAIQVNPQAWLRMSLRNGSLTWVTISPKGGVHIKSLGDAGHLPAELLTTR